jgi:hypothetical protein
MVINEGQGVLVRAFLDEREEDRCDSEERKSAVRSIEVPTLLPV